MLGFGAAPGTSFCRVYVNIVYGFLFLLDVQVYDLTLTAWPRSLPSHVLSLRKLTGVPALIDLLLHLHTLQRGADIGDKLEEGLPFLVQDEVRHSQRSFLVTRARFQVCVGGKLQVPHDILLFVGEVHLLHNSFD